MLARATLQRDPGLHVPPAVAWIVVAVFLMGALAVLKQLLGFHAKVDGLAPLILAGFTAIGAWIALSPNARGCTAGVSDVPVAEVSGLACRIPFGIGAVISGMMAVYSGLAWLRARRRSDDADSSADPLTK